jgi:hypothetical protein
MRSNARFYRVTIEDQGERASHIVVTYNLRLDDPNTFFEFYRLVFSDRFSMSINSVPPGQELSFQEELRALDYAVHVQEANPDNIPDLIEELMQEAYGSDINVDVQQINQADNN